jgi:hypothetical protein
MRTGNVLLENELFAASGAIAAHANAAGGSFRQRDVRFLIELFSNWVESALGNAVLPVKNTQIQRYLETLSADGLAKRTLRQNTPQYRLLRPGLIELISRIAGGEEYRRPEHFYFSFYFISSYRQKLMQLVSEEGRQFPVGLRMDLEGLLDLKNLVDLQIVATNREIKKIEARVHDATEAARIARKMFQQDANLEDITRDLERKHPYNLNSQKPLSELLREVSPDMRRWELEEGNERRPRLIWRPSLKLLQRHLETLKDLRRDEVR